MAGSCLTCTNDAAERIAETGSYQESSNFIKSVTPHGEIDFIVALHLLEPYAIARTIGARIAMVETPAEIMAKQLLYIGPQISPPVTCSFRSNAMP